MLFTPGTGVRRMASAGAPPGQPPPPTLHMSQQQMAAPPQLMTLPRQASLGALLPQQQPPAPVQVQTLQHQHVQLQQQQQQQQPQQPELHSSREHHQQQSFPSHACQSSGYAFGAPPPQAVTPVMTIPRSGSQPDLQATQLLPPRGQSTPQPPQVQTEQTAAATSSPIPSRGGAAPVQQTAWQPGRAGVPLPVAFPPQRRQGSLAATPGAPQGQALAAPPVPAPPPALAQYGQMAQPQLLMQHSQSQQQLGQGQQPQQPKQLEETGRRQQFEQEEEEEEEVKGDSVAQGGHGGATSSASGRPRSVGRSKAAPPRSSSSPRLRSAGSGRGGSTASRPAAPPRDSSPRDTLAAPRRGASPSSRGPANADAQRPIKSNSTTELTSQLQKRCELADQLQRRCDGLYEDAIARQQRLKDKRRSAEQSRAQEGADLQRDSSARIRDYRRQYRYVDRRPHLERVEEDLRKREEHHHGRLREHHLQQQDITEKLELSVSDELRMNGTPSNARSSSVGGATSSDRSMKWPKSHTIPDNSRLRKLLEKQLMISRKMAELEADIRRDRDALASKRAELEARITREEEEDRRYLVMERSAIGHRTRRFFDDSTELSLNGIHDEVQRRVGEILLPEQKARELRLYQRRLEIIHELERLDLQVLKLSTMDRRELTNLGYKLQLSEGWRQALLLETTNMADAEDLDSVAMGLDENDAEPGEANCSAEPDQQCGLSVVLVQEASSPGHSPMCGIRYTYETLPKSEASTAPDCNGDCDAGAANHTHNASTSSLPSVPNDDLVVANKSPEEEQERREPPMPEFVVAARHFKNGHAPH